MPPVGSYMIKAPPTLMGTAIELHGRIKKETQPEKKTVRKKKWKRNNI